MIEASEGLGGFVALPESDLFEVEYWELEQAKLGKSQSKPSLSGEVALVSGASSGIGRACAQALLNRGAAVIGLDINTVSDPENNPSFCEIVADVTDPIALRNAIDAGVQRFGGIDVVVAAAGIFGGIPGVPPAMPSVPAGLPAPARVPVPAPLITSFRSSNHASRL